MTTSLFKLSADERIKSRGLFDQLFESGKGFRIHPFRMVWLSSPFRSKNPVRIAVGAPKKNMRKAVHRNRMKRLMREAYRLQKEKLQLHLQQKDQQLSVFILYVGKELPEYEVVFEKIGTIINRLIKFADANN